MFYGKSDDENACIKGSCLTLTVAAYRPYPRSTVGVGVDSHATVTVTVTFGNLVAVAVDTAAKADTKSSAE